MAEVLEILVRDGGPSPAALAAPARSPFPQLLQPAAPVVASGAVKPAAAGGFARQPALPATPQQPAPFDPRAAARAQMEGENRAKQVREERLRIDAGFRRKEEMSARARKLNAGTAIANAAGSGQSVFNSARDNVIANIPGVGPVIAGALRFASAAAAAPFKMVEKPLQQLGAVDPKFFGDAFQSAVKQVPVFGEALESATKAVRGFFAALEKTADRYAVWSPEIMSAQVDAEIRQMEGDQRRAQQIGPELAEFITAKSKFEDTAQDALVRLLKPLIPIATKILEFLTELVDFVTVTLPNTTIDAKNAIADRINAIVKKLPFTDSHKDVIGKLDRIERNTRPPDDESDDVAKRNLRSLLGMRLQADGPAGGPARPDFRLHLPLFGGGI